MTNYNLFAKTFSESRKNMKWEEINYFLDFLKGKKDLKILDIGCGNGRLLGELLKNKIEFVEYLGIDSSKGLLDEAKNQFPEYDFQELNMLNLKELNQKFDIIFFIASFHHIEKLEDRLNILKNTYNLLYDNGIVLMTNWALNSELNEKKYSSSKIIGGENEFGSIDYNIKIGNFTRFYHSFSLNELENLIKKTGFKLIENKLFTNKKNFITIFQK